MFMDNKWTRRRSVDALLGRGCTPPCEAIQRTPSQGAVHATDFHHFFDGEVAGVHTSTSDAPPPTFMSDPPDWGTGIRELTRGLATLPQKVDPLAFSGQRQG